MRNKAICMWQYLKLNEKINKTSKFVGCSIIMLVMSWARNGQGTCMGPYSLWWAPQTFPRLESMLYLDHLLWFLLWLQENTLQQETIRELWTRQFITHRLWRVYIMHEGHTVMSQRKREGIQTWGSAFIRVWEWVT